MKNNNKPPEPLKWLIETVNLAPMSAKFPDEKELKKRFESETGIILGEGRYISLAMENNDYFWFLQNTVEEICKPFPDLLNHLNRHQNPDSEFVLDIYSDYFLFLDDRRDIKNLIEAAQFALKTGQSAWITDSRPGSNFVITVTVSKEGKFEVFSRSFLETIDGVDANRLKMCPICDTVFWAYRLNQNWCSKACSNVHHQRNIRSDEQKRNTVNEQRRENYKNKKNGVAK